MLFRSDDDFSNFCDLVSEHSADPGSIATCGEYAVSQDGRFVPQFEDAAFEMDINDTVIVNTTFGYHIMWKVDHTQASTLPLEEVAEDVRNLIVQEKTSLEVVTFINALRDEATIERYPLDGSTAADDDADVVDDDSQDDMQVEVEKTRPVREGDFGECLTDANAVLYGVDWAPDVQEQIDLLGEAFDEIEYVDCDPESGDAPEACADIAVYPSWMIDGQMVSGLQSVNALSQRTGCTA